MAKLVQWGASSRGGADLDERYRGYGWLRAQTPADHAADRAGGAGRAKKESAKCKADEASCQQLSQAERRVAVAQCLLQGGAVVRRFLASVRVIPTARRRCCSDPGRPAQHTAAVVGDGKSRSCSAGGCGSSRSKRGRSRDRVWPDG